jgi:hypothetical protein
MSVDEPWGFATILLVVFPHQKFARSPCRYCRMQGITNTEAGRPQIVFVHNKFHENPSIVSKVMKEHTHVT